MENIFRLTCLLVHLLGGKNDLNTLSIISVWDWMIQEANGTDNFCNLLCLIEGVGGIADDHRGLGSLISTSNTHNLSIFVQNLINVRIKHIGTSVDGAES